MSNKTKIIETIDRIDDLDRDLTPDILSIDTQIRHSMRPENMTPRQRAEYERRRQASDEETKLILGAMAASAAILTVGGAIWLAENAGHPDKGNEKPGGIVVDYPLPVENLPQNPSDLTVSVHTKVK